MSKPFSITIGRQYGSAGHEIGNLLGEILGFRVFDKDLITLAAEKNGMDPEYLHRVDEKATNSLLYTLAIGSSLYGARNFGIDVPINDKLFITQAQIIKEAAQTQNCIFVGRCADYILKDQERLMTCFIYADREARIARLCKRHDIDRAEAISQMGKVDKRRANYYNYYTGNKWGSHSNYHLCIDSGLLGVEGTAQLLAQAATRLIEQD